MGYLFGFLAALLFGANGSVAKVLLENGLTPAQLTQLRTLGICVIAAGALLVLDRSGFRLRPRKVAVMAPTMKQIVTTVSCRKNRDWRRSASLSR